MGHGGEFLVTDVVSPGPCVAQIWKLSVGIPSRYTQTLPPSETRKRSSSSSAWATRQSGTTSIMSLPVSVLPWAGVVHPMAYIAPSATIGAGAIVYPGVFIGPFAQLGANVLLNAQVVVSHDARLDNSVVLSPGARLCGHTVRGYGLVSWHGCVDPSESEPGCSQQALCRIGADPIGWGGFSYAWQPGRWAEDFSRSHGWRSRLN